MNNKDVDEGMLDFLVAWDEWADGAAPIPNRWGFERGTGLCSNFVCWWSNSTPDVAASCRQASEWLAARFVRDDLDDMFPFDSQIGYTNRCAMKSHHMNVARRRWVKKTIAELRQGLAL